MLSRFFLLTFFMFTLLTSCLVSKKTSAPDYSAVIYLNNYSDSLSKKDSITTLGDSMQILSIALATNGDIKRQSILNHAASIQKKFAPYMKIPPDSIKNIPLYTFIDEWLYTPYLWGGSSKRGIDCSAFMQKLLSKVYGIIIPRTSFLQYCTENVERFSRWQDLSEGDLVFFKTMPGNPITHVGLYLGNGMFINSSSSHGVSFGNIRDPYWLSKYVASGRLIVSKSQRSAAYY